MWSRLLPIFICPVSVRFSKSSFLNMRPWNLRCLFLAMSISFVDSLVVLKSSSLLRCYLHGVSIRLLFFLLEHCPVFIGICHIFRSRSAIFSLFLRTFFHLLILCLVSERYFSLFICNLDFNSKFPVAYPDR